MNFIEEIRASLKRDLQTAFETGFKCGIAATRFGVTPAVEASSKIAVDGCLSRVDILVDTIRDALDPTPARKTEES